MFCWARDKESVAANTQNSIITTSVCREQLQQVNTTESNTTPQQNQANRQQINSSRALTSMQFWSMIEIDSRVFERNLGKIRFTRKITRKRHIFLLTFWQFHRFREGLIPPLLFQIKCLVWVQWKDCKVQLRYTLTASRWASKVTKVITDGWTGEGGGCRCRCRCRWRWRWRWRWR